MTHAPTTQREAGRSRMQLLGAGVLPVKSIVPSVPGEAAMASIHPGPHTDVRGRGIAKPMRRRHGRHVRPFAPWRLGVEFFIF